MSWTAKSVESIVNVTVAGSQARSDIAALSGGGFAVTWAAQHVGASDAGGPYYSEVIARLFGAGGAASGGEIPVNLIVRDDQTNPAITGLPGGGFAIAYEDGSDATVGGTYDSVRAFSASGTGLFDDFRYGGGSGQYLDGNPDPIVLADGRLIVVHGIEDGATGVAITVAGPSARTLFSFSGNSGSDPQDYASDDPGSVAALAGGGFVHVYRGGRNVEDEDEGALSGVILALRGADGHLIGDPIQASPPGGFNRLPVVAVLADGTVAVAWTSYDSFPLPGVGSSVYYRLFAADGTPLGAPVPASESLDGSQSGADIVALPHGGFLLTWQDDHAAALGDTSGFGIVARSFGNDSVATSDTFLVNAETNGAQVDPHLALLANGDVAISWTDAGAVGGADVKVRLFAQNAGSDVPLGANASGSGNDQFSGDAGDRTGDLFFFDTAKGAPLGRDGIRLFGGKDVLVTTTKIFDSNDDNIIRFGDDRTLDLGIGSAAGLADAAGHKITRLEFDGALEHDGTQYFVYSTVGSSAGLDAVLFG